jgi:hypothetical protein
LSARRKKTAKPSFKIGWAAGASDADAASCWIPPGADQHRSSNQA